MHPIAICTLWQHDCNMQYVCVCLDRLDEIYCFVYDIATSIRLYAIVQ